MITFWIAGQPPRKSNSRQIVRRGRNGPPMIIKSQEARNWTQAALLQVPTNAKKNLGSAKQPLAVSMDIYYTSHRPDLSGELVLDMLQKAGVIKDDRYVYAWHLYKHFDKKRPGVSIAIKTIAYAISKQAQN
jgi:Holliday junction resolvase RusA-like endonuclease